MEQELPKRLIDVGSEQSPFAHLRFTDGQKGVYVALSYCWGSSLETVTTTRASLSRRMKGIEVESLPATFADAIKVCRRLNMHFLWIDALCIVQDDLADWEAEASKMAEIYSHSVITISATMASTPSQGFLRRRKAGLDPKLSWIHPVTHQKGTLNIRSKGQAWIDLLSVDSPLMKRGWTLQERLLSPRVLHYGLHTFYWECRECLRSEDPQFNRDLNPDEGEKDLGYRKFLKQSKNRWMIFEYWSSIVEDYTSRHLSNEADKLLAVSGLAHAVRLKTGDIYHAGLWQSCFARELLWRRGSRDYMTKPSQYRAPSWSWAALDGQVKTFDTSWPITPWMKGHLDDLKFEEAWEREFAVYQIKCKCNPENSLGKVENGWMDVSGPMRKAKHLESGRQYELPRWLSGSVRRYLADDIGVVYFLLDGGGPSGRLWTCVLDCEPDLAFPDRWWLLRIAVNIFLIEDSSHSFQHWALILEYMGGEGQEECYRRLGVAWIFASHSEICEFRGVKPGESIDWEKAWELHSSSDWETKRVYII